LRSSIVQHGHDKLCAKIQLAGQAIFQILTAALFINVFSENHVLNIGKFSNVACFCWNSETEGKLCLNKIHRFSSLFVNVSEICYRKCNVSKTRF